MPDTLKVSIDAFAEERGTTLSATIADRIVTSPLPPYHLAPGPASAKVVKKMTQSLEVARAKEADLGSRLKSAETELQVVKTLGERAEQKIGRCPECQCDISGIDVLAKFKRPSQGHSLVSLIFPPTPQLSQRDTMLLLGALGAVLGIALIAGRS